ncbi:Putative glutamate--cysteine ligase 2 [Pararobbsia alpina]|uniref:Glutamate--cysteine ligase 2 n=1 Tax=Pararobbsia alpina TaxID=621374 RepID=A0A6S7BJN7_9BURK|nr:Putative glutamate--cysteine ligase 2 [Pararobbsia alpina]
MSVDRAAVLVAYIQTLARYLLLDRPLTLHEDDYLVYTFNRFEACRFGLAGTLVAPETGERRTIADDVLATLDKLAPHAEALGSTEALEEIASVARSEINDATWFRETYRHGF